MRLIDLAALPASLLVACGVGQTVKQDSQLTDQAASVAASESRGSSTQSQNTRIDNRSRFTSIAESECPLLEQNLEEGSYWRRRCPGHAGYVLELSESDLRQDLVVVSPDGKRAELQLSSIVARGAFNSLGDTIEWRGHTPDEPKAMIVRMNVAHGSEPDRPDISNLVVVRLAEPFCAVAVVAPQPDQNARARTIADGDLGSCLEADRS